MPSQIATDACLAPEPAPDEQSGLCGEVELLQSAWRSRWLVVLCSAIGGEIDWFVLQIVTPLVTSTFTN